MDFGGLPPEVNSARMYAGPGPESLSAAATAWDGMAAELHAAANSYRSVIAGLTTTRWMGPSSLAMASAFGPYVAWTAAAAARAAEAGGQAKLAVEIYEAAFAMTVPPPAVMANRVQLATLVATNFFGQNSTAIAATEAEYGEMWAQDATAMYQYAANSAAACEVTPFTSPPNTVNALGLAEQTAVSAQATTVSGETQSSLANLVSSVPATLQALTSPASAVSAESFIPGIGTLPGVGTTLTSFETNIPYYLPTYFMAGATPLYGMSSILGMAQTAQGLANNAANAAAGAAAGAAQAAAGAASSGASALGPGVLGSIGTASQLGPMSVPPSWTSVIPSAASATGLPTATLTGAHGQPNVMGGLPMGRSGGQRPTSLPRYGVVPTAMTRPPSAG
jgi:PPE-repeat protein